MVLPTRTKYMPPSKPRCTAPDSNGWRQDNKIDKEELEHTLRSLGYDPVKVNQYGISEVEQMIWEVDEDSDGGVSMEEFMLMFERGRNDRTGHEPKKLFNLCQFMCSECRTTLSQTPELPVRVLLVNAAVSACTARFLYVSLLGTLRCPCLPLVVHHLSMSLGL